MDTGLFPTSVACLKNLTGSSLSLAACIGSAMPDFVFRANIAHYRSLLERETDLAKVEQIKKLLAKEEAKLADWHVKRNRDSAE